MVHNWVISGVGNDHGWFRCTNCGCGYYIQYWDGQKLPATDAIVGGRRKSGTCQEVIDDTAELMTEKIKALLSAENINTWAVIDKVINSLMDFSQVE